MANQLHLEIIGTGSYLPPEIISNSYFLNRPLRKYDVKGEIIEERTFITEEEIIERTGIKERRKARPDQSPSDLGYIAAKRAIENSGIRTDTITGIILASVTENINFPSGACKIQKQLEIKNCFAYDIANACAGFPEALSQANARVATRPGNYLVIASECLTQIVDYHGINSTLFGDGAGAAVLTPTESERGIRAEYSICNPHEGRDKRIFRDKENFLRMPEGNLVLKSAIRNMVKSAKEIKKQLGWERADVYIPHQANIRIIEGVAERVKKDGAIIFNNIEKVGNMSAATCAVGLNEALRTGTIKQGHKVIITSFGGGEVTAAVAIQF